MFQTGYFSKLVKQPPSLYGLSLKGGKTQQALINLPALFRAVQSRASGGGDGSSDTVAYNIATGILAKIPDNFDTEAVLRRWESGISCARL